VGAVDKVIGSGLAPSMEAWDATPVDYDVDWPGGRNWRSARRRGGWAGP
jgi:hypothetical protein